MTDTTTLSNDNDDWETAVDTGEFDKRLAHQEKVHANNQEPIIPTVSSSANDGDSWNTSNVNLMNSNKPIRILKRPTSQNQLSTANNSTNASTTSIPTNLNTNNNTNNDSSSLTTNISSSKTVPTVSIIPRNTTKGSTTNSPSLSTPTFTSSSATCQPAKPAIKTYEQRELEYKLARLRIMGEEESSVNDSNDATTNESGFISADGTTKPTSSASSSTTARSTNKTNANVQRSLQCQSTPGSYASNLYTLNYGTSNTGPIQCAPNNNNSNNSDIPNIGTGPYSSLNLRGAFPAPYAAVQPQPVRSHFPTTANKTIYMTSTTPFVNAPSVSSSFNATDTQQDPNSSSNNWYQYQNS